MTARWKSVFAAVLLGSTALAGAAQAQAQFNNIVIIGDSLSDTGNTPKYASVTVPGPSTLTGTNALAAASFLVPPYYGYRFSNGPIYADTLGAKLGASGSTTDTAVGGAFTGQYSNTNMFFGVPVSGGNINTSIGGLTNTSLQSQVLGLLGSGASFGSRDLAVVYGGANDAFATLSALGYVATNVGLPSQTAITMQFTTTATTVATNLGTEIAELHAAGVNNFVVPNLPNLGATPAFLGTPLASAATQLAAGTNQAVAAAMATLSRQLGVNITIVDTSALFADMISNPAKYGLTNVTQQCYSTTQAGLVSGAFTTCSSPNTYLFWDTVHPTTTTQQIFSQYVASILQGPTVVGAQGNMVEIATQGGLDAALDHTGALRRSALYPSADLGADTMMNAGDKKIGVFVSVTGGQGSRQNEANALGFHYTESQAIFGTDVYLLPNVVVGLLGDFGSSNAKLSSGMGNDVMTSTNLVGYAAAWGDHYYGTMGFLYGFDNFSRLNRNTFVANQVASATASGKTKAYYVKVGPTFHPFGVTVMPAIGYQDVQISIGSQNESGAVGINQSVGAQSIRSRILSFGGEVSYPLDVMGLAVLPTLRASWNQEEGPITRSIVTTNISQPNTSVSTTIGGLGRNFYRFGANIDARATSWLVVDANVDAGQGGGRSDIAGTLQLRAKF